MSKAVPRLRFHEFSSEWKNKKLDELTSDGMYGLNAAAKEFDGVNKYIRITDIDENSNKFVPTPLTSPEGDLDEKFLLKENDLVFARTGASTGKSYLYNRNDGKLYFAGFLIKFHVNKANSKFVFYNTLRSQYDNWVKIMSVRSGQPGINAEEYKKLELKVPSTPEQDKIASFLSKVDEKIGKLEEKQQLWETYKKGMIQQIFSQKLRFKDENEEEYTDWEEKKLGDIAKFSKGKGISKNDISNGGMECIRYGELYTTYKEEIKDIASKTNLKVDGLVLSDKNDIIIPTSGETAIDIATASCVMKSGVAIGGDTTIIKTDENGLFLSYYLNHQKKEIAGLAQGVSVVHLYPVHLKVLELKIPHIKEQNKIVNFLSAVENKIELLDKELGINREFKKGLLQQMFC